MRRQTFLSLTRKAAFRWIGPFKWGKAKKTKSNPRGGRGHQQRVSRQLVGKTSTPIKWEGKADPIPNNQAIQKFHNVEVQGPEQQRREVKEPGFWL